MIPLLQKIELLDTTVDVVAGIRPRVGGVMSPYIRIGIRKVDFARFRSHIGECIENVGEVVNREIPRVVAMTVDCLKERRRIFPLAVQGTHTQLTKHATGRYPFRQVSASFS
jgi:hypothetical protein